MSDIQELVSSAIWHSTTLDSDGSERAAEVVIERLVLEEEAVVEYPATFDGEVTFTDGRLYHGGRDITDELPCKRRYVTQWQEVGGDE